MYLGVNGATHGKYAKYVDKGANMAADKFTSYQEKPGRCFPQIPTLTTAACPD
jgi:hypothetical protein